MQSFLIISKSAEKAKEYVASFAKEQKIDNLDIYSFAAEKTLGIPDVRSLNQQIFLRPIKGDKKIIVVEAFYGATIEAQNSFLKILEEPPLSTYIFILASENYFLPTINSRTKNVELDKSVVLTKEDQLKSVEVLENLEKEGIGYRLKLAEDLSKDKNSSLLFLEKFIVFLREKMVNSGKIESKDHLSKYKNMIEVLSQYYKEIKQSNVNLRLGLENLFLEL